MGKNLVSNYDWISQNWAEKITHVGSVSDGRVGYESGSSFSYQIRTNWGDRNQVLLDLLGNNYYDRATGLLSRKVPVRHPDSDGFFAMGVTSMKGVKFEAKQRGLASKVEGTTSAYDQCEMTVTFQQPPWWFTLSDVELDGLYPQVNVTVTNPTTRDTSMKKTRQEWYRYCSVKSSPKTEVISSLGSNWKRGGPAGTPGLDALLNVPVARTLRKISLVLSWHRVPLRGLVSSTSGLPDNLIVNTGCVNNATFLGQAAGTILYRGYDLDEHPDPDMLTFAALGRFSESFKMVTVKMNLEIFDPPIRDGATERGHNLTPNVDGYWDPIYPEADTTKAKRLLDSFDMRSLFVLPG